MLLTDVLEDRWIGGALYFEVRHRTLFQAANMVILDHGFGILTKYGHLSRIAVQVGSRVTRGDVIGYVGSTGRSTGAHLHYEVWMNGRLTNPMQLLATP